MKTRCLNPSHNKYRLYGGRGIKVCDEWANSFHNFYEWAICNGYRNGLTLDRINSNGNYEPSNCRWATYKLQNNNNRRNHFITYHNKSQTISQWADSLGLTYNTLYGRLYLNNWDMNVALDEGRYKNA